MKSSTRIVVGQIANRAKSLNNSSRLQLSTFKQHEDSRTSYLLIVLRHFIQSASHGEITHETRVYKNGLVAVVYAFGLAIGENDKLNRVGPSLVQCK